MSDRSRVHTNPDYTEMVGKRTIPILQQSYTEIWTIINSGEETPLSVREAGRLFGNKHEKKRKNEKTNKKKRTKAARLPLFCQQHAGVECHKNICLVCHYCTVKQNKLKVARTTTTTKTIKKYKQLVRHAVLAIHKCCPCNSESVAELG